MTRRLILMRHAKSSWDDLMLEDHERTLNARGQRSAKAIGGWLSEQGYTPDAALCSTATRTRETLELSGLTPQTEYLKGLYHASAERILSLIQAHGTGETLLVVCHNPGIAEFAERIVTQAPRHARFFDYPTAATLVVDLPVDDWAEAGFETGAPVGFIVPRELTD